MKQVKFLMVALTLLMGVTFSSCLNGDKNTLVSGYSFMRVVDKIPTYSFSLNGVTYVATNTIANFTADYNDMVYVVWQYDSELQEVNANTKKVNVEVKYAEKIDSPTVVAQNESAPGDVKANRPIVSVTASNGGIPVKPMLYDEKTIIVPVFFSAAEDIDKHSFTMVYYSDENNAVADNTNIVLHLRHNSAEEQAKESYTGVSYRAFDLTRFIMSLGKTPTKITIKTKENSYNKLEEAIDKEYIIDYKINN